MFSLTYISSVTRTPSRADLEELMTTSRRHNAAADLSGMLLHADGHFMQTLEGDRRTVLELMERIEVDERHRDVVIALEGEVEERAFPGWSMGCRSLSPRQVADIEGFNDFFDPGSEFYRTTDQLGRAGVFHRIFRDTVTRD